VESDKIREVLAKKRNEEFQARQKLNNSINE